MSRKRTPDEKPPEASPINPPAPDTGTAVAEPPAPANNSPPAATDTQPSFAERVGQRVRVSTADPYVIAADAALGVRLYESKRDRQMAIKFDEKPSRAVLDSMHDAGWAWRQADKIWTHVVTPESAVTTRIKAERLYQEVCRMIRQENRNRGRTRSAILTGSQRGDHDRIRQPTTFHDLGPEAQTMSNNCKNERMAMILQSVAIGSMIIMAGVAASRLLKEVLRITRFRTRPRQVKMKTPGSSRDDQRQETPREPPARQRSPRPGTRCG